VPCWTRALLLHTPHGTATHWAQHTTTPQENIRRNFGMPQPNGYRKAMRFMRHANKFGLPIITFVDTPGAYAGRTAEELGQVRALCALRARRAVCAAPVARGAAR
jgi:acetyl-CoA carboxylase alpha subunit